MKQHLHKITNKAISFFKSFKSPTFISVLFLAIILISANADFIKTKLLAAGNPTIGGYAWSDMITGWISAEGAGSYPYNVNVDSVTGKITGWMWSDMIGWVSMASTTSKCSNGSSCPYGVTVNASTSQLGGYAWSDNIGWISFNNTACPTGVTGDCTPRLTSNAGGYNYGFVRAIANGGGWDGYISLASTTFNFTGTPPFTSYNSGSSEDGACGTASLSATFPTTGFCGYGVYQSNLTPSSSSGPAPWRWTCAGKNGGLTVSCSTKQTLTVDVTDSSADLYTGTSHTITSSATLDSIGNVYHRIDMVGPLATAPVTESDWASGYGVLSAYPVGGSPSPDNVNITHTFDVAGTYYIRGAVATTTQAGATWKYSTVTAITLTDNAATPKVIQPVTPKVTQNPNGNTCADAYFQYSCTSASNQYVVYLGGNKAFGTSSLGGSYTTPKLSPLTDGVYNLYCLNVSGWRGNTVVISSPVSATCNTNSLNNDPKIIVTATPSSINPNGSFKLNFSKLSSDTVGALGYVNPNNCKVYQAGIPSPIASSITNAMQSQTIKLTSTTKFTLSCYPNINGGSMGSNDTFKKLIQITVGTTGEQ